MTELELLEEVDRRVRHYVCGAANQRVLTDCEALAGLA